MRRYHLVMLLACAIPVMNAGACIFAGQQDVVTMDTAASVDAVSEPPPAQASAADDLEAQVQEFSERERLAMDALWQQLQREKAEIDQEVNRIMLEQEASIAAEVTDYEEKAPAAGQ